MDLITGLPTTSQGNDAILTFIDRLTKQAHFVPTRVTVGAREVAALYMQHVYRLHGLSKSIVSDRDPRFTAELFRAIFKQLGVRLDFSTANHPQTDGQTERVHRTIGQILRSAVNHRQNSWEEVLPMCEFAYNDMVQAIDLRDTIFPQLRSSSIVRARYVDEHSTDILPRSARLGAPPAGSTAGGKRLHPGCHSESRILR